MSDLPVATYPSAKSDRETAFNRLEGEDLWDVFTSSPSFAKRLISLGWQPDIEWTGEGRRFFIPINAVTIRKRSAVENLKSLAVGRRPSWLSKAV